MKNRKRRIVTLIGIVLSICVVVAGLYFLAPKFATISLTLKGEKRITVEAGGEYTEAGATANWKLWKNTKNLPVQTIGKVDTKTLGTYKIEYIAQYKGKTVTDYRTVSVVDTQKPVIELVADPERYTLPGNAYEEEGYTATDNFDGDITHKVVVVENDGIVTYTVADAFGNITTVQRQIRYLDPEPPELMLKGSEEYTITIGQHYVEEGWEAVDNCDGDISDRVEVSGSVDRYTPGEYRLTYTVKDNFGNETSINRLVCVESWDPANGDAPVAGPSNGKVIYLTFDDGPGKHTPRLLNVLKKYNVKATFFVVKNANKKTIIREAAEGHTVAAHTASHVYKTIYASEEAYFEDLDTVRNMILDLTGQTCNLIRFPGGSSNKTSSFNPGIMTRLTKAVEEKGYVYFDWQVDSKDSAGAKTAQEVFQNVTKGIAACKSDSIIVLQHDIKIYSIDAVESIIVWGLENGYTFRALTADSPIYHHTVRN